jgi:hypothetical protein
VSVLEAEAKGWSREREQVMRSGCGLEGRPQASRARGRVVCRLRTVMRECGSGVLRASSWGVRRGGIFGIFGF